MKNFILALLMGIAATVGAQTYQFTYPNPATLVISEGAVSLTTDNEVLSFRIKERDIFNGGQVVILNHHAKLITENGNATLFLKHGRIISYKQGYTCNFTVPTHETTYEDITPPPVKPTYLSYLTNKGEVIEYYLDKVVISKKGQIIELFPIDKVTYDKGGWIYYQEAMKKDCPTCETIYDTVAYYKDGIGNYAK